MSAVGRQMPMPALKWDPALVPMSQKPMFVRKWDSAQARMSAVLYRTIHVGYRKENITNLAGNIMIVYTLILIPNSRYISIQIGRLQATLE